MTAKFSLLGAVLLAVIGAVGTSTSEAVEVNATFEEGSFEAAGLFDFSNISNPTLTADAGAGGSTALNFGSDGVSASASGLIDETITFSMMGRYNGNIGSSGGVMAFGWSQAAAAFNPFVGTSTSPSVLVTDHVTVGLARTTGNAFTLAAANGTSGALIDGALFGSTVASLINGNWYRLEGTVLFDSLAKAFTFNDISLDNFGSTGAGEVTPNILSGTGKVVTAPTFGTTGSAIYVTNRDRGVQITDNYVATTVPEPTSLVLMAGGACLLGMRRRRA